MNCPIYLALGTNLGDRLHNLESTFNRLSESGIEVVRRSNIYETEPVGGIRQPDFLNLCCEISSALQPLDLLKSCLRIEAALGRKRILKNGPRSIDIDLLFYGSKVLTSNGLTIPHPGIYDRRFVLQPLSEIAADFVDPVTNRPVIDLLSACPDESGVWLFDESGEHRVSGECQIQEHSI